MADKVRVGVVGTSWWTDTFLLPMFKFERSSLTAICGRNRAHADEIAAKHGIQQVFTDYRQMIDQAGIDAVVVATPDDTHYPIVMAALDAGMHIFCEKPVALNSHDAKAMYEKAQAARVKHMVMYSWHWLPALQRFKQLADEGYIGKSQVGRFEWLTSWGRSSEYQWRYDANRANGVLGDLGSHMIHIAMWVLGDVATVSAQLGTYFERRNAEGDSVKAANDSAMLLLQFTRGAQVQLEVSAVNHEVSRPFARCSVSGEYGSISAGWAVGVPIFSTYLRAGRENDDEPTLEETDIDILNYFQSKTRGPRLFIESILDDKPTYPGLYEGYKVQQVIDAALLSHHTGCRVAIEA